MSHWPETTDGGDNDATVDRMLKRSVVVAPTRERLTAIAEAVEAAPKIGRRSVGVELGELRWLLAQAERLAAMKPASDDELRAECAQIAERSNFPLEHAHWWEAGRFNGVRAAERRLLAPPPQPSTSTPSPPVEAREESERG